MCLRARPFVPVTTNSRQLARRAEPCQGNDGPDQLWVADITFLHLAEDSMPRTLSARHPFFALSIGTDEVIEEVLVAIAEGYADPSLL